MQMEIVRLEIFFIGSHEQWARDMMKVSKHSFRLLELPGRHWQWRMHGGAIYVFRKVRRAQYCRACK